MVSALISIVRQRPGVDGGNSQGALESAQFEDKKVCSWKCQMCLGREGKAMQQTPNPSRPNPYGSGILSRVDLDG
jgi:hypothetical protein